MLLAVDVDYRKNGSAVAAAVAFSSWQSSVVESTFVKRVPVVQPYQPGRFFERELPCLLAVLDEYPDRPETIIVDGYVVLGTSKRAGLGTYLFEALDKTVPIIGVAKSKYADTPVESEVFRGSSSRPIYVTSIGICSCLARNHIRSMHGEHRMPTMLTAVDRACRDDDL